MEKYLARILLKYSEYLVSGYQLNAGNNNRGSQLSA